MWSEGTRLWLTLACAVTILGGCATVPAAPAGAQSSSTTNNDEYEGWLFKSLTGKKTSPDAASAKPAAPGGPTTNQAASGAVQQASATEPVNTVPGPLVPGPASPSTKKMAAPPTDPQMSPSSSIAGPPPTIPSELPPPPAEAVSIKEAQAEAEKKKGFELADLAPENVYKNIKKATGYGPNEKIARAAMQEGKALYSEKKYKEAAAKFATAADRWPDTPLEEDALFMQGESEFFADNYSKAHDTFGGLLKKYTNTRHLDTVMSREFAIGRFWEQLYTEKPSWPVTPNFTDNNKPMFDTFGYAVQAFERVRLNDPTGPLADASLLALGNAYFRRGQFENAAYNYDLLRKEYPNSKYQKSAHVLGLQAKMRIYQGTMYVQGPLDDAKKIADQTLTQFDEKQLGQDRERLMRARAQILEEKANREFALAEYYSQKQYYGAARMYYQGVIENYPGTERAAQSKARMEAIRNEPDSPPNHFAWLTEMFDSKKQ